MRKTEKGWQLTIYLDDKTGDFYAQLADLDCRTPENLARFILKQKMVEKTKGSIKERNGD